MGNFGSILLKIIICGCLYGGVCYYFKIFGQLSNSIIQIFITNINDYFGKNFSFVRRRHSFIKKRPSGNSSSRSLITSLTS